MNPIVIKSFRRPRTRADEEMDYEMSKTYFREWSGERAWADEILKHLTEIGLRFQLDKLTKGSGNCLMIAVLQQLNRPELFSELPEDVRTMARSLDHQAFRRYVRQSAEVHRGDLEVFLENQSWNSYWIRMLNDGIWADILFIQAVALSLKINIHICGLNQTASEPWMMIDGAPDIGPTIYLGWYHNRKDYSGGHYQSILPVALPPSKKKTTSAAVLTSQKWEDHEQNEFEGLCGHLPSPPSPSKTTSAVVLTSQVNLVN